MYVILCIRSAIGSEVCFTCVIEGYVYGTCLRHVLMMMVHDMVHLCDDMIHC
jgi:hypothetical protein